MAKRFIDTELFDDEWYMDLSKDSKIFWIYCITKCNHAGILELNKKLCKYQTGIKDLQTVFKELDNRLVTLKQPYIFIPKFLFYQYPNFPNSNVKAQKSAIDILIKFDVLDKSSLTLKEGLSNSYEYGNGYEYGYGNEKEDEKKLKKESVDSKKNIPDFEEFLNYAKQIEPLIDDNAVRYKYNAWVENGWKDGYDKQIKNWKTKISNTIPHLNKKQKQNNYDPSKLFE